MNLQPTILYKYFMGKKVELEDRTRLSIPFALFDTERCLLTF